MTAETKNWFVRAWLHVKGWCYKYIGALFMTDGEGGKKDISLSRCAFIAVLGYMFYFWQTWTDVLTLTPEAIAEAILLNLPDESAANGVELLAAAQKVVDNIPKTEPPLLKEAFLALIGIVFGNKLIGLAKQKLNGGNEE